MNKLLYYITAMILLQSIIFGSVRLNDTNLDQSSYTITQFATSSELSLKITLEYLKISTVTENGKPFTRIDIPGEGFQYVVGKPRLPVIRKMIEIPEGCKVEWDITIDKEEVLSLRKNNYHEPILPVQPFQRKSDPKQQTFSIDKELYESDHFYQPGTIRIGSIFQMGGFRGAMFEFYPVDYNPVQNSLKIHSEVTIQIRFIKDRMDSEFFDKPKVPHPELSKIAREMFINFDEPKTEITPQPLNLLVIAGDRFVDHPDLQEYLKWKSQSGFYVILKSVSELGNTPESIKDSISAEYNGDTPPAYILLIGDVEDVPAWNGSESETETDVPYTQISVGDYIPDLMIGRFSVSSNEELSAVIHKSMNYEQCRYEDIEALNKITFISTDDDESWWIAEGSHNYVINNHLNPRGIQSDHIKGHSGGNTADIHRALNDGRTICHYSGHGLEYEWQGPEFTMTDIATLDSSSVSFFVISNACETGSYLMAECFGESWIRAENRGAFAFVGASNSSYWDPDDWMERRMYDGYFQEEKYSISAMVQRGLFEVFQQNTSMGKYYYDIYNILGDPTIVPWIGIPKSLSVNYNPIHSTDSDLFDVVVQNEGVNVENAKVTLTRDWNIIGYGITDFDGRVSIILDSTMLQTGQMLLTVTGNQYIPYIDTVNVIHPLTVTLDTSAIPVGETTQKEITVHDSDANPYDSLEIYIAGWTVSADSLLGVTDSDGVLNFQILPKYGETLAIKGKNPEDENFLFSEPLQVSGGVSFQNAEISAGVPAYGVTDALLPGKVGIIQASCDESNCSIAVSGCGIDTVASGKIIEVVPEFTGVIRAGILMQGYNVFEESFAVKKVYGTVSGLVNDTNHQALAGVSIAGFLLPDTIDAVFNCVTNDAGEYSYQLSVEVGEYRIKASLFGYLSQTFDHIIQTGENTIGIEMNELARTMVSGSVTGNPSEQPLDAEIVLYRMDDNELPIYHTTVTTLASEGGTYQVELPQASYLFRASSPRYITDNVLVFIDAQPVNLDFILDTTLAGILLVDDDSGKRSIDKNDTYTIDLGEGKGSSAVEIQNVLESDGYYVFKTVYTSGLSAELSDYDMVISSSGSNMSPVVEDAYRLMLEQYVENGGKLLIEGGEVGYDAAYDPVYPSFKEKVLHINEWNADKANSLYRLVTDHDLVTQPNALPYEIGINYSSFGDEDACTPTLDAQIIYFNNNSSLYGGIILYEDPENIHGTKVIFYTFAFDKLADEIVQKNLLENTIEFLLAEPDLIKGDVNKDGSVNILDMVKIVNFILYPDQQPDEYEQWAADLNSDQDINVLDLVWVINKLLGREGFTKPTDFVEGKLEIFQQNGQIRYKASKPIAGLEIQFDSDCYPVFSNHIIENNMITARAEKNKLLLYSINGDDILADEGIIATLSSNGKIQKVIAADHFGNNVDVSVGLLPGSFVLHRNYPNPFNASTVIRFDIPVETHVTIEIFDILGRKVGILTDENKPPGFYEIFWDGRGKDSKILPSGVYFYAITAGQFHRLHKMALVK